MCSQPFCVKARGPLLYLSTAPKGRPRAISLHVVSGDMDIKETKWLMVKESRACAGARAKLVRMSNALKVDG